jgi:hypothetical protein
MLRRTITGLQTACAYALLFGGFGMAPLKFICPRSGNEVDTGLDLDAQSFASLPRETTELSCPHCDEPHLLAGVSAWLGERRSIGKKS